MAHSICMKAGSRHAAFMTDPLEAFFSGISSIILRIGIAVMVPFLCFLGFDRDPGWESIVRFVPSGLGMMFSWGTFGSVFPLGVVTAGAIVFCTYAFIQDWDSKRSFYWLTVASILHFAPLYNHDFGIGGDDPDSGMLSHDWWVIGRALLVIAVFSGVYALFPRLINAIGRCLETYGINHHEGLQVHPIKLEGVNSPR